MIDSRDQKILDFIKNSGASSSKEVHDNLNLSVSYATMKRILSKLATEKLLTSIGRGKATKYIISPVYMLVEPLSVEEYYEKEIDERDIMETFNFSVIDEILAEHSVFTESELENLNQLQLKFQKNISQLTDEEYKKEFERLAIDLSWKSSQIEGNLYKSI